MKKVYIIIVLIIALLGVWYFGTKKSSVTVPSTTATYRNSTNGIGFTYPKILTARTEYGITSLRHSVPFEHHDYCDFKGEATTTIPTLTDFHVRFYIVEKNIIGTMKQESPYIPAENFVNNTVIPSPGFIDSVEIGTLKGYKIFEGAEGCGHTIYYFEIEKNKTLVVIQDFITIFSGAIDVEQGAKALLVPGVISKEKEAEIFDSIVKTIEVR